MNYYPIQTNYFPALVAFFRKKNALSLESAVALTSLDILEMGLSPSMKFEKIYTFIKVTSDQRYWLDETQIVPYFERQKKIMTNIFIGFLIFMVLSIFLPYLLTF